MALMIQRGRELIRINTQKNNIEYSTDSGRCWNLRYSSSSCGTFYDLYDNGKELLCCCSKGVYYSTDSGRCWNARYTGSAHGKFLQIASDGRYLLATTEKGLVYSTDGGRCWNRR